MPDLFERLMADIKLDGTTVRMDHLDTIENSMWSERHIEELRHARDACQDIENGLSYGRRLTQGRADIVALETERRRDGSDAAVLDQLPEALARHTRGTGNPRPVRYGELPPFTDVLIAQIDDLVSPADLGQMTELSDEELERIVAVLTSVERSISDARQRLHSVIDLLQSQIVERYRAGSASVDDLLK